LMVLRFMVPGTCVKIQVYVSLTGVKVFLLTRQTLGQSPR
jgi:hypothetical protein